MDKRKPLFIITATVTDGCNDHSETQDGAVKVDLSALKDMGGPGIASTVTPEHLFAIGYAACFGGRIGLCCKISQKGRNKS